MHKTAILTVLLSLLYLHFSKAKVDEFTKLKDLLL